MRGTLVKLLFLTRMPVRAFSFYQLDAFASWCLAQEATKQELPVLPHEESHSVEGRFQQHLTETNILKVARIFLILIVGYVLLLLYLMQSTLDNCCLWEAGMVINVD